MAVLKDLEGIAAKEIECEFIDKPSDVKKILSKGKAATTAGDNGAINIWKDDKGRYRCAAMQWMRTVEQKDFRDIDQAIRWAAKWIKTINQ